VRLLMLAISAPHFVGHDILEPACPHSGPAACVEV
jgi:hypothetical protein